MESKADLLRRRIAYYERRLAERPPAEEAGIYMMELAKTRGDLKALEDPRNDRP